MSRPPLLTALRFARRSSSSPAAGARAFGRAAAFTGLLVLGRALWLRAASRRFRQIRGTRVGALDGPAPGSASGAPGAASMWSAASRPAPSDAAPTDSPATAPESFDRSGAGYVDGTAEDLPPEASA